MGIGSGSGGLVVSDCGSSAGVEQATNVTTPMAIHFAFKKLNCCRILIAMNLLVNLSIQFHG